MDPQAFQLMNERMIRIEDKLDKVLEFKWKFVGISTCAGVVGAAVFKIVLQVL